MLKGIVRIAAAAMVLAGQQAYAQSLRPIAAISQMEDLTNSGQSQVFSTMIETAIASTNKFRVMERSRLGNLLEEQARAKANLVTTRTPGRTGGFEGVDYLIYGSITSVSAVNKTDFGTALLSGLSSSDNRRATCYFTEATLSVDIKITDADSGEVRYVKRIDRREKSKPTCGGGSSIDLSGLLRGAAEEIATGLVTAVYPIQIAAVQPDGVIVLNYGEGAVKTGDILSVFIKGEAIIDPATKEVIANNEERIGALRITDVLGRVSKAQAITNFPAAPPVGSIVRPATEAEKSQIQRSRRH